MQQAPQSGRQFIRCSEVTRQLPAGMPEEFRAKVGIVPLNGIAPPAPLILIRPTAQNR